MVWMDEGVKILKSKKPFLFHGVQHGMVLR